jgi:hypothetical protein
MVVPSSTLAEAVHRAGIHEGCGNQLRLPAPLCPTSATFRMFDAS